MGRYSNPTRLQRVIASGQQPKKEVVTTTPPGECLFDRLPAEIVAIVLGFVPPSPSNLSSLLRVCRSWTSAIEFDPRKPKGHN
ncbi:Fbox domain containing protein [Acanthamoeba castellanii str. Neff]|uniref:Fbox domain containing protein n=1 Tax=Acanthamoeba castellanii (strain ATCC 30010 / Neff) TaxID=1257118 RepID=L8HEN4_ACACF|nr:Fbox domain containing protein [Acanthamoeba castellanii str. Neff]ELR23605.1 Fbox domain containing protein [Acanthamoeba castellanii str. Neff]